MARKNRYRILYVLAVKDKIIIESNILEQNI